MGSDVVSDARAELDAEPEPEPEPEPEQASAEGEGAVQPRKFGASERYKRKRPSVIVRNAHSVQRIAAPTHARMPTPTTGGARRVGPGSEPSEDEGRERAPGSSVSEERGPSVLLLVFVAAVVGAALTVAVVRQFTASKREPPSARVPSVEGASADQKNDRGPPQAEGSSIETPVMKAPSAAAQQGAKSHGSLGSSGDLLPRPAATTPSASEEPHRPRRDSRGARAKEGDPDAEKVTGAANSDATEGRSGAHLGELKDPFHGRR
jgi:hypothetical protein